MDVSARGSTATPVRERRSGSKQIVEKLTTERAEMLLLYCRVAGLSPYEPSKDRVVHMELLQEFCQVLVDYVAAGHFSLYERIVNGEERRRSVSEMAEKLYPQIATTTEIALDFNDKYDCEDHCEIDEHFDEDLSQLGEALATRIEIEDKLIAALS